MFIFPQIYWPSYLTRPWNQVPGMSVSVSCMRESALEQKVGADSFGLSVLGVFWGFFVFPHAMADTTSRGP